MNAQIDFDAAVRRLLLDVFTQARRTHWLGRAATWADAAPRPGDFVGQATPEELRSQAEHCHAVAAACRAHAELVPVQDLEQELAVLLGEVA